MANHMRCHHNNYGIIVNTRRQSNENLSTKFKTRNVWNETLKQVKELRFNDFNS